ncbi:unnamed protein product [Aspergillus oryzae]|uniref:Mediator of RNA polymerase II transcription subunit 5 n=2 Tax=Aspergillus oryzae TaxID=5062 RepID=A0AAN4YTS3_ASPOZ|nr:unnamed protein product [Aspergillus oryzae]GMF84228.1 unnamed protein product [Aspergillus oryzae]GMG10936.1 unnamed protein product [Aspergillus oryzae]GMG36470.1 unnamed protein product [Aspergillus oryzae]GMG44120.1 unnamed protein product [Aspergillus oryzae var. brunneus]
MGKVQTSTVLTSLLKYSSIHDKPQSPSSETVQSKMALKCYTLMTDIRVIQDAMLSVSTGSTPKSLAEAVGIFSAIIDWIQAVVAWHNNHIDPSQQTGGLMSSPDAVSLFESLGILLTALSGTGKGIEVLSSDSHEALKVKLGQALSAYLPLCMEVSLPLRNRLDSLQKGFNLYGEPPNKSLQSMMDNVNVNALQFEASVMDGPVINSRAGLYIYINAMVITATFDVLSNALYRNESSRTMFLFRSFLVNKLPSFFAAMLAASMVSLPMEMCISHALSRLDPNTFPSFSQMFAMQGSTVLSEVRPEFLFACASHKLIPESSIERLLGENPMQTPPVGYNKDDLVSQINTNQERAEQLVSELESTEGNAGAIVAAITEALDVILLFRSAKQVLQPLCALLDSWHWDEDQGESQPVYDEFGSILLLVLTFKYRYDLRPYDLGITSNDSFVLKLLDCGSSSQNLDDLSEKQNRNLGAWITALFIAEGISEETMSSCSPQEFYLLVTTLFNQSLTACEAGKLEFDTLKGGFEFVALTWLGNHIWETESDPTIPLKTLQSLVNPSSISGDAREIHKTVLNITARSLDEQLKDIRSRHPNRADIKPILDVLEPCLSFQRTGSCHRSELDSWTTHSPGGLLGSIRSTFQGLVLWSTSPGVSMAPHSYTHRQLVAGIRMLGSARVLTAIVDELKMQTETGNADLALDIAVTMICAPLAESFAIEQSNYHPVDPNKEPLPRCPVLTLRDALNLQHENVPKLSEKDPLRAEVIVRLYRRVNALMTPTSQMPNLDMSNIIQDMQLGVEDHGQMDLEPAGAGHGVGDDDAANLNRMLDNAAAAAAAGLDSGMGQGMGGGLDTSIDDVLNAADMAVGNPEFLDLDMEGMF